MASAIKPPEPSDLVKLLAGDPQAWNDFVPYAAAIMRAVIRRVLATAQRAEETPDVLQDAFTRLVRDHFALLRRFDPQRASLSTWLGVVATSAARDFLRRRVPRTVELSEAPAQLLATRDPVREESRLALPPALLTARQSLILKLLYEDDLDVNEVAELLNIEPQSVRSQRHKALVQLREHLRQRPGDVPGGYDV